MDNEVSKLELAWIRLGDDQAIYRRAPSPFTQNGKHTFGSAYVEVTRRVIVHTSGEHDHVSEWALVVDGLVMDTVTKLNTWMKYKMSEKRMQFFGLALDGRELSGEVIMDTTGFKHKYGAIGGAYTFGDIGGAYARFIGGASLHVKVPDWYIERTREAYRVVKIDANEPRKYELPKTLEVGKFYRTRHCPDSVDTDFRILSITNIRKGDRHIVQQTRLDTNAPPEDMVEKCIVVFETCPPEADGVWFTTCTRTRAQFIEKMYELCPVEFAPPDVQGMLADLVRRHACLPNETSAVIFASSKAYAVLKEKWHPYDVSHELRKITFQGFDVIEVPAINGYKAWFGTN